MPSNHKVLPLERLNIPNECSPSKFYWTSKKVMNSLMYVILYAQCSGSQLLCILYHNLLLTCNYVLLQFPINSLLWFTWWLRSLLACAYVTLSETLVVHFPMFGIYARCSICCWLICHLISFVPLVGMLNNDIACPNLMSCVLIMSVEFLRFDVPVNLMCPSTAQTLTATFLSSFTLHDVLCDSLQ